MENSDLLTFWKKNTVLPRGVNGIFFREFSKSYKLTMFHLRMIKFFVATKVRFLNTRMQTSVYVIKHTKSRNVRTKAVAGFFLRPSSHKNTALSQKNAQG